MSSSSGGDGVALSNISSEVSALGFANLDTGSSQFEQSETSLLRFRGRGILESGEQPSSQILEER